MTDSQRPHLRPSFIIVGAQRAGTSSLFRMLTLHQQVISPRAKELHFFDRDEIYGGGIDDYWSLFPRDPGNGMLITGEATPSYLYLDEVPGRIHRHLPDVTIVAILRDPVKRAFSAWNMYRTLSTFPGREHLFDPRTFDAAIEEELAGGGENRAHRYLERGYYARQLRRYSELFGREQVHVFGYPQLINDRVGVIDRIFKATGIPPFNGDMGSLDVRKNMLNYAKGIHPALEARMRDHLAPHMQELDELLGIALDLNEAPR